MIPPCIYCDYPAEAWDHIVPRTAGGGDEPSNVAPACRGCNSAKSGRSAEYFLRDHPGVLARVRAHQVGADVLSMLKPGEKPRVVQKAGAGKKFLAEGGEHPGRWVRGNRTQFSLLIAPDLLQRVDVIAQRENLSRAALLTVWINEQLRRDATAEAA